MSKLEVLDASYGGNTPEHMPGQEVLGLTSPEFQYFLWKYHRRVLRAFKRFRRRSTLHWIRKSKAACKP